MPSRDGHAPMCVCVCVYNTHSRTHAWTRATPPLSAVLRRGTPQHDATDQTEPPSKDMGLIAPYTHSAGEWRDVGETRGASGRCPGRGAVALRPDSLRRFWRPRTFFSTFGKICRRSIAAAEKLVNKFSIDYTHRGQACVPSTRRWPQCGCIRTQCRLWPSAATCSSLMSR